MNPTRILIGRHPPFLNLSLCALVAMIGGPAPGFAGPKTSASSGDWNAASTWNPSGVPSSTDDVTIKASHSITVSATPATAVNSITILGGNLTQLTVNPGATLTVTSDFTHNVPTSGFITTVIAVNGSLNVGGAYASTAYSTRHTELLLGAVGSCAISGTYRTTSASLTDMVNGGTLSLGGSPAWDGEIGTLTAGSGTVAYSRAGSQTVLATAYNNLTLSGSATKTLGAGTTIVYGTLSKQSTATLALGGHTLTYGTAAILDYRGSGPQTTSTAEFPATMSAAVTINNSSGVTLDAAKTVNKNLTIASGGVLNNGGYAITMGSGCNFSVNSGATFFLTGNSGMVTVSGTGTKAFDPTSTVNYAGTTQTVSSETYGNLTISAGTKTFTGPVTVNGTLALDGSAVASLASGGSYTANTLTIAGVNKRRGVWGSSDSGAANQDNTHFAGNGVLNVTSGPISNPSNTALASSANPSAYGSPVTFTATVTGTGPAPTGTVTFKEGSTSLGAGTLNGAGVATFIVSTLPVAGSPHSITAVYAGDGNFDGSTSSAVLQTVNKSNPSVTAWPTAAAITYGQSLADATLTGGSATPGGTFAFTTPSTAPSAGTALQSETYTPNDTANYNTASGTVNVTVNPRAATLSGTRAYDGTATAVAGILSVVNKVGSDDVTVESGSGTLSGKDAGAQTIASAGNLALGGAAGGNYTLAGASGSVTISPAALGITANDDNKTYGETKSYGSGSTAFTSSGLQNGETVDSVTVTASGGTGGTDPVGEYALTPSAATGGNFSADNYSVSYHPGKLRVFPRLSGSSASGSLSGYIGHTIKVRFVAKDRDGKGLATNQVQLATGDGGSSFAYSIGVPPDTATLCLKPRFFLRGSIPVPAAIRTANEVPLTITNFFKGGDADNNNQVDGNDYACVRALWGKSTNTQFDVNGDGKIDAEDFPNLNGDGYIDALDYALLKGGWYQKGEDE
jgi:hypothetical protein